MKNLINLKSLYKLPWTETNNPNGWIEPTTFCQLKCPGCYRWIDTGKVIAKHLPLDLVKKQVDSFVEKRNVQTISISGGEPLLYPDLIELVKYIDSKKLFSQIYTNGLALNKELLIKLKEAGATELVVHIDMFQNIPLWEGKNEAELNELRQKYVDLFKEVGGINLGFIMPISPDNIMYLGDIFDFLRSNLETVNLIVFTVYKDASGNEKDNFDINILIGELQKIINYNPCGYLQKIKDPNRIAWIFQSGFGNNENYFGNLSSNLYEKISKNYYKKRGKFFFISKKNKLKNLWNILPVIFYKNGLTILKNILFAKNKNVFNQTILIIDPPNVFGDRCDGCPDAMYLGSEDKLYPSCSINNFPEYKHEFLKND